MLKDHNAVTPVRLEPAAHRSRVKHSTNEALRSYVLGYIVDSLKFCGDKNQSNGIADGSVCPGFEFSEDCQMSAERAFWIIASEEVLYFLNLPVCLFMSLSLSLSLFKPHDSIMQTQGQAHS